LRQNGSVERKICSRRPSKRTAGVENNAKEIIEVTFTSIQRMSLVRALVK
jgi:hypothetical protein